MSFVIRGWRIVDEAALIFKRRSTKACLLDTNRSRRLRNMKKPPSQTPPVITAASPTTRDALCKRLAEDYPAQFAHWLFDARGPVKVEKTELQREPVRADAVLFSHADNETLHAEFQTTHQSVPPVPLRMLDYFVGLKRLAPERRVRQVLVMLKPTGVAIPNCFTAERTRHEYDVIRLWEQDPAALLPYEGLLPLATLCRAASGARLLNTVAARIRQIKSPTQQREVLNWSRVLAGLRYDSDLIYQTLKENEMLEESVVYQDILRKGEQLGVQLGVTEGERRVALRLLKRRFGKVPPGVQKQLAGLAAAQLEELCEAVLFFQTPSDLRGWFKQHAAKG